MPAGYVMFLASHIEILDKQITGQLLVSFLISNKSMWWNHFVVALLNYTDTMKHGVFSSIAQVLDFKK